MIIPTALVIDDDSVVREFIRLHLEALGWDVREANSAASGLILFRQQRPQLVTLDLLMSSDDLCASLNLATLLKAEAPDVAILVITALASDEKIQSFMSTHHIELYDKSFKDPYLSAVFARLNVFNTFAAP